MPKIVVLWSDVVVLATLALLVLYGIRIHASANLRATWLKVLRDRPAACASVVLVLFFAVAVVDSFHFRRALDATAGAGAGQVQAYGTRTESLLDVLLARELAGRETSYSAPLAIRGFTKDSVDTGGGGIERIHPRLAHGGEQLADDAQWLPDVRSRIALGLALGLLAAALIALFAALALARFHRQPLRSAASALLRNRTELPWRAVLVTVLVLCLLGGPLFALARHYHVFGTDRTGNDVFYQALKSIRTAFVIGTLSTIATLPLAVGLGLVAGYLRGWVDEAVQYAYTLLSSIPNVLLIAACVLMMQVFIDTHPDLF
ncbi:MAG TPA: ABC transporter permease, partial [Burkholderiaceae bacterium]|nr:ABC transporter permease [Burkholderiaceae bacterium]